MIADALLEAAKSLTTLEQIMTWGMKHDPPLLIAEMVQQDEFTLDVILPLAPDVYVIYGVT